MEISAGGLVLHLDVDGDDDAPPVLLLHGITSSARTWAWLVDDLVETSRVLRLDLRGHGGSGRAPGAYQPAGYLADVVAAVEQVAGGPCAVVGHSLGAMTGLALAQRRPDLVRCLVLEDPPLAVVGGSGPQAGDAALLATFRLMRDSAPGLQAAGMPVERLAEVLAGSPSPAGPPFCEVLHPDGIEAMAAGMLAMDPTVLDPVLDGTIVPALDLDAGVAAPGLLLCADPASPDACARPAEVDRLRAGSPGLEVRTLAGGSHLLHDELAHREPVREAALDVLAGTA